MSALRPKCELCLGEGRMPSLFVDGGWDQCWECEGTGYDLGYVPGQEIKRAIEESEDE